MKIDFSKIVFISLDNKPIQDVDGKELLPHKVVAQAIYIGTKKLALVPAALEINEGKAVELSETDLEEIKSLYGPGCGVSAFIRKAILDFIEQTEKADK